MKNFNFVLDVDGVLTSGNLYIHQKESFLKNLVLMMLIH